MFRYTLSIFLTFSFLACTKKEAVYTNEECKFSIAFPKEPKKEVVDYEEPFKYQLKSFIYFADSTSGDINLSYEVRYTEVPKGILDKLSKEEIHNQMFGMLGNVSDHPERLVGKKILDGEDYICEEYEILAGNEEYGYIRQYYQNNKLYQVFLITKNSKSKNKSVGLFLDSFQML